MENPCKGCGHSKSYAIGKTGKRHQYICRNIEVCNKCEKHKKYLVKHEQELEKRRKFKKSSETINSIDEILKYQWVWVFGKPKHMGFVSSLQLHLVSELIKRGAIHKVIYKKVEEK